MKINLWKRVKQAENETSSFSLSNVSSAQVSLVSLSPITLSLADWLCNSSVTVAVLRIQAVTRTDSHCNNGFSCLLAGEKPAAMQHPTKSAANAQTPLNFYVFCCQTVGLLVLLLLQNFKQTIIVLHTPTMGFSVT